jgi:endonuclease/exonuclease/phosphatase family metal-dependent hydrolase
MSSSSNRKSIRLLTFNIFIRPPIVVTRDKRDERLPKIVKFINESNYDVICLQELFGYRTLFSNHSDKKRRKKLLKETEKKYPYCFASTLTSNNAPIDSGLVILSKYKIATSGEKSFPSKTLRGYDKYSKKGFIWAGMIIHGKSFLFINTHTQAIYDKIKDYNNVKSQLNIINDWIKTQFSTYDHILLLGDLNTPKRDHFPEHIDANSIDYTWPTPLISSQQKSEKLNLDYILVIKGKKFSSSKVLYNITNLSDHYPVEAEINY